MKAISKTAAAALVIASLLGAAVAVVSAGAPAAAVHPAPQAATAIEYALLHSASILRCARSAPGRRSASVRQLHSC